MMDLTRHRLRTRLEEAIQKNPIVVLAGPRQCGKTTLARAIADQTPSTFFDLEHPADAQRLENPNQVLAPLSGLIVLDNVHRHDTLFEAVRIWVEKHPASTHFLFIGSSSPNWAKGRAKALGGKAAWIEMGTFAWNEVGQDRWKRLWNRGGYPGAFLAEDDQGSLTWRQNFIRTLLETELPKQGIQVPAQTLRRLLQMLAHQHGQVVNTSTLGRSLGAAHTTVKRQIEILTEALILRQLPPWRESISKRQVKFPKVYIRDTGLLHALMNLETSSDLEGHPLLSVSLECFCIENILRIVGEKNAWFWETHGQAELDLLVIYQGRRFGFDFQFADPPKTNRSMHIAHEDLKLERLFIVYPGLAGSYPVWDWAEVIAIADLEKRLAEVFAEPPLEKAVVHLPEPEVLAPKLGFSKFFTGM